MLFLYPVLSATSVNIYLFIFRLSCARTSLTQFSLISSQESAKVSDLNPNAKAWANHMFSLDPSGSSDTTTAALQPWKEGCNSLADPGPEGRSEGFGDAKYVHRFHA